MNIILTYYINKYQLNTYTIVLLIVVSTLKRVSRS